MTLSRRQKREVQQQQADMRELLSNPVGRRVLARVLSISGVMTRNPKADPVIEGRRMVGLDLIDAMTEVDPYGYPAIMAEEIKRLQRDVAVETEENGDDD